MTNLLNSFASIANPMLLSCFDLKTLWTWQTLIVQLGITLLSLLYRYGVESDQLGHDNSCFHNVKAAMDMSWSVADIPSTTHNVVIKAILLLVFVRTGIVSCREKQVLHAAKDNFMVLCFRRITSSASAGFPKIIQLFGSDYAVLILGTTIALHRRANEVVEKAESPSRLENIPPEDTIDIAQQINSSWIETHAVDQQLSRTLRDVKGRKDLDTGSTPTFMMLRYWLQMCTQSHWRCEVGEKTPYLPTRVLDVGPRKGTRDPYLYITKIAEEGRYCALSHRWEQDNSYVLTQAKLDPYKTTISLSELPKTFQDAIAITRKLNIRYLWIDALCIIQDSESDWHSQAKKMAAVYKGAYLTIAASEKLLAGRGIFRPRSGHLRRPMPCVPDDPSGLSFNFVGPGERRPHGELDNRGWVLQEQLLSRRIVTYVNGQIFWDCIECSASEAWPIGVPGNVDVGFRDADIRVFKRLLWRLPGSARVGVSTFRLWFKVVEQYTRRRLTFDSDVFAALLGIATEIAETLDHEMVAGLWKKDFACGLLWSVRQPQGSVTTTSPRAEWIPSWSWASTGHSVSYSDVSYRNVYVEMTPCIKLTHIGPSAKGTMIGTASFVIVEGCLATMYPGGCEGVDEPLLFTRPPEEYTGVPVIDGFVRRLVTKVQRAQRPNTRAHISEYASAIGYKGTYSGRETGRTTAQRSRLLDWWEPWYPDKAEYGTLPEVTCLMVGVTDEYQYCLCLVPVSGAKDTYRRVGVCAWRFDHFHFGWTNASNGTGESSRSGSWRGLHPIKLV